MSRLRAVPGIGHRIDGNGESRSTTNRRDVLRYLCMGVVLSAIAPLSSCKKVYTCLECPEGEETPSCSSESIGVGVCHLTDVDYPAGTAGFNLDFDLRSDCSNQELQALIDQGGKVPGLDISVVDDNGNQAAYLVTIQGTVDGSPVYYSRTNAGPSPKDIPWELLRDANFQVYIGGLDIQNNQVQGNLRLQYTGGEIVKNLACPVPVQPQCQDIITDTSAPATFEATGNNREDGVICAPLEICNTVGQLQLGMILDFGHAGPVQFVATLADGTELLLSSSGDIWDPINQYTGPRDFNESQMRQGTSFDDIVKIECRFWGAPNTPIPHNKTARLFVNNGMFATQT